MKSQDQSAAATTKSIRARPWRRALAWLAFLGPFFYASYGLANYLATQRESVGAIVFDWERQIPFWPWTIFPYWTINAFYALSLFLAPTRRVLDRHALRLVTVQVIAVSCFLIWPLQFTFGQPAVEGAPAWLFDALRGFDKPFNQAPSLHIALAVILWDFYRRLLAAPWARAVLHVWTMMICISVLTTYQHHFIDIPTGALLGIVCVWLWPLEARASQLQAWRMTGDPRRLKLASLYFAGAAVFAGMATLGYANVSGWWLWLWWPAISLLFVACAYLFGGERFVQVDAHGRMHWSARWLLAFYRLGAQLNAKAWTARIASAHQVVPGVWLGRLPNEAQWREQGQPVLVSFCGELQAPAAAEVHCQPILDLTVPRPERLKKASALIERAVARAQHRQAEVHLCCALGFSRSAAALACWLVRTSRCADVDDAVRAILRARPQIVLNERWLVAIRQAVLLPGRSS